MKFQKCLLVIILFFFCFQLEATNKVKEDSIAKQLFVEAEKKAIEFRKKTLHIRFVDGIEMNELFYKVVMKESPALYNDTHKYKNGLLDILKDKKIRRDATTNQDVFRILYNLCVDDYVDVIDSVYSFYKHKQVKFDDLYDAIVIDFNMSNLVAKKYKNERLQRLLLQIQQDIKTGKLSVVTPPFGFQEEIENLISGKLWEDELKEDVKIHPSLLKQSGCN